MTTPWIGFRVKKGMQMGEAARRKAEIAALKTKDALWLASLSPEEKIIAKVSQTAYEKIVGMLGMTEGCYNLAFFLYEYLRRKHGIQTKIVVGWVNDGQWDGATSHAWVEYQEKRIDISLHKTSHPDAQPSGDLVILDHVVRQGEVTYAYWPTLPEGAAKVLEAMRGESPALNEVITHKEREHRRISALALTKDGVGEYFGKAPDSVSYEFLARMVG